MKAATATRVGRSAGKRLIADPPNRLAAFHFEQAAEKLVKAVRLGRGLRVTPLSAYATTYRYPSPTGKRKGGPSNDEVVLWIKTIAGLTVEARAELVG